MDLGINLEFKKNIPIIHLKGDLLINNMHIFLEVLSAQVHKNPTVIALDFHKLDSLDEPAILRMKKYFDCIDAQLVLYDAKPKITNRLQYSSLQKNVNITTRENFELEFFGKKH